MLRVSEVALCQYFKSKVDFLEDLVVFKAADIGRGLNRPSRTEVSRRGQRFSSRPSSGSTGRLPPRKETKVLRRLSPKLL